MPRSQVSPWAKMALREGWMSPEELLALSPLPETLKTTHPKHYAALVLVGYLAETGELSGDVAGLACTEILLAARRGMPVKALLESMEAVQRRLPPIRNQKGRSD